MDNKLPNRKQLRLQNFDYSTPGAYFITICTLKRKCILSRILGTGVLDCPQTHIVGTGVLDCPQTHIVGAGVPDCPQTELTRHGKIADKYIKQLNDFYNHVSVEEYVIMPNHIHLLLWVKENKNATDNGQSRTPVTDGQSRTPVTDGQSRTPVTDGQSRTPVPTNVERANNACSQFVSTFKRFCNKEYGENIWQSRFNDHIIRNRDDYEEHVNIYTKTQLVGITTNYTQRNRGMD